MVVVVTWAMLREMPTVVKLPFQALVDDDLLAAERLTLALLYAYADDHGLVEETVVTLQMPRGLHKNSVRRHLQKLEKLRYLVPINKAVKLDRIPQRKIAEGYALTLRPDGQRWPAAPDSARIGSRNWNTKSRWE